MKHNTTKAVILIVEDEVRLAEILKKQLEEAGFNIQLSGDGYMGKKFVTENHYDLVILDINLPLINGYDLCREIRKVDNSIPIIMLTALAGADNKVAGFDSGADDYVTKPYDIRELIARINVFLKRSEVVNYSEVIGMADLEIDLVNKTVTRSGQKIELTVKEFNLLELFLKNPGKLLSREFIISQIWGIDFDPGTNVIDVYVNYLRKKIDKDFEPKLIHTKFGFGFYCNESEI